MTFFGKIFLLPSAFRNVKNRITKNFSLSRSFINDKILAGNYKIFKIPYMPKLI